MEISVIIPTYNHGRYVGGAIESALSQTRKVAEVIVVDDGSTDETRGVVEGFGDQVRYLYQPNRGLSAARNTGIKAARGDWLAFLDADDFWLPEKMEKQAEQVSKSPDAVLVYCSAWHLTPDGAKILAEAIDPRHLWPTLRYKNCVSGGSAAIVRKDAVLEVGFFDESLRACEDWDMWMRLAVKYRRHFLVSPEPLVVIRSASTTMSADYVRMTENTEKILDKTLLLGLGSLDRLLWRRRIRSADFYRAAITARYSGYKLERTLLWKSVLQWPSPFFAKERWRALQLNCLKSISAGRKTSRHHNVRSAKSLDPPAAS